MAQHILHIFLKHKLQAYFISLVNMFLAPDFLGEGSLLLNICCISQ